MEAEHKVSVLVVLDARSPLAVGCPRPLPRLHLALQRSHKLSLHGHNVQRKCKCTCLECRVSWV